MPSLSMHAWRGLELELLRYLPKARELRIPSSPDTDITVPASQPDIDSEHIGWDREARGEFREVALVRKQVSY